MKSYNKYFRSEIKVSVGDIVQAGAFGQARVTFSLDGEAQLENVHTGEKTVMLVSECDFISRSMLTPNRAPTP